MAVFILMRERKKLDLDGRVGGEKLGGIGGRKIVIRIYYARKKSIFNRRMKKE